MSVMMQPGHFVASENCYALTKAREQFKPTAYKPVKKDPWTIAWGHTAGVKEGDTCTYAQGEQYLRDDMAGAIAALNRHVTVPLTPDEVDALGDFVFNVGEPNFEESTLLRKLNDRQYTAAANELLKWKYAHGVMLAGLLARREAEQALFDKP